MGLEECVKFLNKNAYIQCSITSKSFCFAAKDAFFLILRNTMIFALAGSLGAIFMSLGKWFVTIATTAIMYKLLTEKYKPNDGDVKGLSGSSGLWFVIIICFALSYAIGTMFMMVWGMAVDT